MKGSFHMANGGRFFVLAIATAFCIVSPAAAKPAPGALFLGEGSHIRLEILEDRVEVMQVLHVHNRKDTDYEPQMGLELGLPSGARQVQSNRKMLIDSSLDPVSIAGPFTPGVNLVRLRFVVPLKGQTLEYHQSFGIESEVMHVILPDIPGIDVSGRNVMNVARHHAEGLHLLVIDVGTHGGHLSFGLVGLPSRMEIGRWIALALAGIALFAGLVFGLLGGPRKDDHRARLEKEKGAILDEIEQLEIDRNEGIIDMPDYAVDHDDLLTRLTSILRELEARGK